MQYDRLSGERETFQGFPTYFLNCMASINFGFLNEKNGERILIQ